MTIIHSYISFVKGVSKIFTRVNAIFLKTLDKKKFVCYNIIDLLGVVKASTGILRHNKRVVRANSL